MPVGTGLYVPLLAVSATPTFEVPVIEAPVVVEKSPLMTIALAAEVEELLL